MKRPTHTPGPWDLEIITDICVQSADLSENGKRGVAEANARLIAAAPELLEALRSLQKAIHDGRLLDVKKRFDLCVADSAASKAIAKAEAQS